MQKLCLCLAALLSGCAIGQPQFHYAIPNMSVKNVNQSKDFYTHLLGFKPKDIGPNFVVLQRDQITLALIQATDKRPAGQSWCYLMVSNVHPLFEEYKTAGANFLSPYKNYGGGHVEFTLQDPDGNTLDVGN